MPENDDTSMNGVACSGLSFSAIQGGTIDLFQRAGGHVVLAIEVMQYSHNTPSLAAFLTPYATVFLPQLRLSRKLLAIELF